MASKQGWPTLDMSIRTGRTVQTGSRHTVRFFQPGVRREDGASHLKFLQK